MIQIKEGAKIEGIRPEIFLGLLAIQDAFKRFGYDTIITEGTGGHHKEGSLHYKGLAVDIRSKHITSLNIKALVTAEGKKIVGSNFDFFLEDANTENEHYHLEFDPK